MLLWEGRSSYEGPHAPTLVEVHTGKVFMLEGASHVGFGKRKFFQLEKEVPRETLTYRKFHGFLEDNSISFQNGPFEKGTFIHFRRVFCSKT